MEKIKLHIYNKAFEYYKVKTISKSNISILVVVSWGRPVSVKEVSHRSLVCSALPTKSLLYFINKWGTIRIFHRLLSLMGIGEML